MDPAADLESTVRARLRALRHSLGWSLDELAARSHLSASTISRIETGKRAIALDVLVALARGLQVDVDDLVGGRDGQDDDDVVIRPEPTAGRPGATTWMLSRPTGRTTAVKMRLEATEAEPDQRVHPGHDWLFVLSGSIRLALGERVIVVHAGEAAEFSTMTPHAVSAVDGEAEIVMIVDRDGQRAHLHHDHEA